MDITFFNPIQQFHYKVRNILGKRSKVKDMPFIVHNADRTSAEHTCLIHQPLCHNSVGSQKIFNGIRVQFIQPLINLVSVFYLCNIFRWCQDMFAI